MQVSSEQSCTRNISQELPSTITEDRKRLPIWQHRKILIETIKQNDNCIIVSSTGSGKTTQLPQFIYESGLATDGIVAITQPRRVAAISVAQRVAEELGQGAVGTGPVGYCVRFEDCSDPRTTRLRYMTDGMLLREAVLDPTLTRYKYVILDEAHERSLNTDVLFGIVLRAAQKRAKSRAIWLRKARAAATANNSVPSCSSSSSSLPADPPIDSTRAPTCLKIIVMSATIDPTPFVNFLGSDRTRVIYIEGRPHPIKVLNMSDPAADYVADAATACIQIHRSKSCPLDRGILIFLTGEEEIMRCCSLITQFARLIPQAPPPPANGRVSSPSASPVGSNQPGQFNIKVFPLFASLPQGKQLTALSFSQPNCRKVIVSTNLAETSITIPGIRYVIDCGYAKVRYWDTQCGLESFRVQRISKSQAWQRAGRAGREAAGVCLRLYTDAEYKKMPLHPQPELVRAPMAGVLLNLIAMNVKHPQQFPWLTAPKEQSLEASLQLLYRLGAVESECVNAPVNYSLHNGYAQGPSTSRSPPLSTSSEVQLMQPLHLTPLGSLMSAFPLEPRFSRVLISSAQLGCLVEVLSILSMLYVSPVFYVPADKREAFGEAQQQFHHPDGDLTSLLLVYRAYLKKARPARGNPEPNSSGALSTNNQNANTRQAWCRAHFLNRARLDTAIRVRNQLKQVARGSGLAPAGGFRSCGPDMYKITQAFVMSGFQDQVALLADSALLSTSNPATLDELNRSRRSVYTLAGGSRPSTGDRLFLIHPESQLYLSSLSDTPPPAVLFIETAAAAISIQSNSIPDKTDPHVPVYMRHVATVQWGCTANHMQSANKAEFAQWLSSLLANKSHSGSSKKRQRQHDREELSTERGCVKRALMTENLETQEADSVQNSNEQLNPNVNVTPCEQSAILTKRQRKRLAKRRRRIRARETEMTSVLETEKKL